MMTKNKKVIIVGGGFAGLAVAQGLINTPLEITLIDRNNYHLFQPMLYQVATAVLSPADIALPIRNIFSNKKNIKVVMDEVITINPHEQFVQSNNNNIYTYDYLIIATGANNSYFGHNEWEKKAPGLKDIKDAILLRERMLSAFEKAEITTDLQERQMYLTFILIGAGPTGVEMAGAIRGLSTYSLANDFTTINPKDARIILLEAGPKILSGFPKELSQAALKNLRKMNVEVRTNEKVIDIQENCVVLSSDIIKAKTIIWTAGVRASPAATWLHSKADKTGRIIVNDDFSLPAFPNIFAIGDTCAYQEAGSENYLPGTAAVAKQQGHYLAYAIRARIKGKNIRPFRYRNYGNLAAIGKKFAIAYFGFVQLKGVIAYILWWLVHIYFLIGFRNRLAVTINWLWSHFASHHSARLIIKLNKEDNNPGIY